MPPKVMIRAGALALALQFVALLPGGEPMVFAPAFYDQGGPGGKHEQRVRESEPGIGYTVRRSSAGTCVPTTDPECDRSVQLWTYCSLHADCREKNYISNSFTYTMLYDGLNVFSGFPGWGKLVLGLVLP